MSFTCPKSVTKHIKYNFLPANNIGSYFHFLSMTKTAHRKSSTTKNQLFRRLIEQAVKNKVLFEHILADNWFDSKANMAHIHSDLQKSFIIGIKSNRTLALSENDANNGRYTKVRDLELDEDVVYTVWLKGLNFPVRLGWD